MKMLVALLTLVLMSGCATIPQMGGEPIIRYGETVQVVNGLRNQVRITYRTEEIGTLAPGQEARFHNLRAGEYLVAHVYENGEMIGARDLQVRAQRDRRPQMWRITSFRRLR